MANNSYRKRANKRKRMTIIISIEILVILLLVGAFLFFNRNSGDNKNNNKGSNNGATVDKGDKDKDKNNEEKLTPEQIEAQKEQERLQKEEQDRKDLIAQADRLSLSYDYDAAIELLKGYKGSEGSYEVYTTITDAIKKHETTKESLLLYGGSYKSVTEFNHVFFHTLVVDNSKAFDGDERQTGYNMYMTTIYEFNKMMQKMYDDGYVLVSVHDILKKEKQEDGTVKYVPQKIYLPEGKKPFVLSQDDVSYYVYMEGDGFARRLIIGEDGKPTNDMVLDDGSIVTGDFDMVPIIDRFVEEHPDFSYRGAKGILALTGYNGVLGYRTNDPESPTYAQDVEDAKKVAEVLKKEGWEFASHGWGHRNSLKISDSEFIKDTTRWMDEVAPILGPTDLYIFPFGIDIETTMGLYTTAKYKCLKDFGFEFYFGVDKKPWMQIWNDYVRMARRPLDGQAMLQFPERLTDLFNVEDVLDPGRPARDW